MNYFVSATYAVTIDGEWVTPESVQQVDFDSLHCIYCKLQICVQFDPLTAKRLFVHRQGHIDDFPLLKNCRFNKLQTIPDQTFVIPFTQTIPPLRKLLRPLNTAIKDWRCCWCQICWYGEKVCPQCDDCVYAIIA